MPSAERRPGWGGLNKDPSPDDYEYDAYLEETDPKRLKEIARDFTERLRETLSYYDSLDETPLREELVKALGELVSVADNEIKRGQ